MKSGVPERAIIFHSSTELIADEPAKSQEVIAITCHNVLTRQIPLSLLVNEGSLVGDLPCAHLWVPTARADIITTSILPGIKASNDYSALINNGRI